MKFDRNWKMQLFWIIGIIVVAIIVAVSSKSGVMSSPPTSEASYLGSEEAPVTLVHFGDYQCPYCRKFHSETYPGIKAHIESGKLLYVFKEFPLDIHPQARIASEAALCVKQQGGEEAYWGMYEQIFEKQNVLDSGSPTGAVSKIVTFTEQDLVDWAEELGYDIQNCLSRHETSSIVDSNIQEGLSLGARGTPTFIINGNLIDGPQDYYSIKLAIEKEIANA